MCPLPPLPQKKSWRWSKYIIMCQGTDWLLGSDWLLASVSAADWLLASVSVADWLLASVSVADRGRGT